MAREVLHVELPSLWQWQVYEILTDGPVPALPGLIWHIGPGQIHISSAILAWQNYQGGEKWPYKGKNECDNL